MGGGGRVGVGVGEEEEGGGQSGTDLSIPSQKSLIPLCSQRRDFRFCARGIPRWRGGDGLATRELRPEEGCGWRGGWGWGRWMGVGDGFAKGHTTHGRHGS